ncbi:hypothetical protein [Spirosoma flavum]|uniref:Lipoprotein n=1 Tax=Spirosoma flavum TaxID=2048557 RepID=A0ABW6AN35_9BACT
MRPLFVCFAISLFSSTCFGQSQADSSKTTQEPVQKQVSIPGVDTPTSGPGMTAQMPTNPMPPAQSNKKRKTSPPSDPRAFGVGIPVGKTKKDTLRD